MTDDIDKTKQAIRERVWALPDEHGVVQPPGAAGHIPAFVGAGEAAARLADLPEWKATRVVKANPDRAQLPIRVQALREGKVLYMVVPALATAQRFYLLNPQDFDASFEVAAPSKAPLKWLGGSAFRLLQNNVLDRRRWVPAGTCGSRV